MTGGPDRLPQDIPPRPEEFLARSGVGAGAVVADIGFGSGGLALAAARLAGADGTVYAVEASVSHLRQFLEMGPPDNVLLLRLRPGGLPIPAGSLDMAILRPGGAEILKEAFRALKPGGRVLVVGPRPGGGSGSATGLLAELREAGFEDPSAIDWGPAHGAASARMPAEAPSLLPAAKTLRSVREIVLGPGVYGSILGHCRRKTWGEYLEGETKERKAFGLLTGRLCAGGGCLVGAAHSLFRNLRYEAPWRGRIDEVMGRFAEPSETPLAQRGWVADPREVLAVGCAAERAGEEVVGSYHTHRVAWKKDPVRDSATVVDRELGRGSGVWCLVVSMVDPALPSIRAFYEGDPAAEIPVRIAAPAVQARSK